MQRQHKKTSRSPHGPRYEDLPDLCTVDEARRYLRIGRNQAYDLIARGVILSERYGRSIRVPKTALR